VEPILQLAFELGLPLVLLIAAYVTGSLIEGAHFRELRSRESASRSFPTVTLQELPPSWTVLHAELVTGNVVVSLDYFKRFLAGLRMLFGGRVTAYESLLDRARREAIMRVKETARKRGAHAVINVRLETSRLASSRRNGKGTAGVEVLAFGTALKLAR
jgi:uncharacterized protein YbjQ (UPF0145 family)